MVQLEWKFAETGKVKSSLSHGSYSSSNNALGRLLLNSFSPPHCGVGKLPWRAGGRIVPFHRRS